MTLRDWTAWGLDFWTWGWVAWLLFFVVWETLSGVYGGREMLTDHLRPVIGAAPILWWTMFGLWLWLGVHLLAPAVEAWIARSVG